MIAVISPFAHNIGAGLHHAKDYPFWADVVGGLKQRGFNIIQVGGPGEPNLPGVDETKLGLPLRELKNLVLSADLLFSIDNFFQHWCALHRCKCIVVWGKSDPHIFGHDTNINLYKPEKLRPDQFNIWHGVQMDPESFVSAQEVLAAADALILEKQQGCVFPPSKQHTVNVLGTEIILFDTHESVSVPKIAEEINKGVYSLDRISMKPDDWVLDIGAHVGTFSIYCALRWGIRSMAYEPCPFNRANLLKNIGLNGVEKYITISEKAVWSKSDEKIRMHFVSWNSGGTSIFAQGEEFFASTISLDDAIRNFPDGSNIAYLKMDCEGAEKEILSSSELFEKRCSTWMGLEIHQGCTGVRNHCQAIYGADLFITGND